MAAGCAGSEGPGSGETATSDREPPSSKAPPPVRRAERIGQSTQGRPIRGVAVGAPKSARTVIVVGCIHGTECAGMAITRELLAGPAPRQSRLWVIPNLNPDGHARGSRLNARGVDLNRNFPSDWRTNGQLGDPEYAGPRPLSEPESRAAVRLIRRARPRLTIWFHQPQDVVRAWGRSAGPARRYADRAGARFRALPWLSGTAPNWQNRRFRSGASFVVELPPGALPAEVARRHAESIRRFAR
jgi:murein peptide amidase A